MEELKFLEEQQVAPELIKRVEEFRSRYEVAPETAGRIVKPSIPFYGKDILEMAIAGLLKGENLLLTGPKATGKNILAENLAYIFNRPAYNVSFHVNTNSGDLIGTDTFVDNEVKRRKGTIYQCAEYGGFGILDEINMAKNDAVSVLHATLDYRRSIDVPGYDKIDLHPAARFIGTMNYGYAGTKELNEALVSRFLVIDMPAQTEESLEFIFHRMFPKIKENARTQFIGVFHQTSGSARSPCSHEDCRNRTFSEKSSYYGSGEQDFRYFRERNRRGYRENQNSGRLDKG